MGRAYTKEFLVDAFVYRYTTCTMLTIEQLCRLEDMANEFYDKVGKDKFREYCSLDAQALKDYKIAASNG